MWIHFLNQILFFKVEIKFGVLRITYYISGMKKKIKIDENEKRVVKSYKVKPTVYAVAKMKAEKNKTTVANILENYLYDFATR
jgi:hypothetical protein